MQGVALGDDVGMDASELGLLVAVMLAAAVEFVEAFTIVLAMGITRDWRSTLAGTAAALVVLALVTIVAGYALVQWFPESLLQLVIGTLLLIFGLQWLRKAVLRSAGLKALHDEEAIFRTEAAAAEGAGSETVMGLDWFAFVVSFKGVLLEGLEVVFIVLTFGLTAGNVPWRRGAAIAGAIVLAVGAVLHRPLSRVPEITIKHGVGILLTTFGTFWASRALASRAGRRSLSGRAASWRSSSCWWPGSPCRGRSCSRSIAVAEPAPAVAATGRRCVRRRLRTLHADFVVGDDWRIAAGAVGVLAAGAVVLAITRRAVAPRSRSR
jgi:uncharacterized membrane protein